MATATQNFTEHLSLAELMETPEYREIAAARQRLFVSTVAGHFITTGILDPTFAAGAVYDTENARVFAYGLMGTRKIRAALDRFFGRSERESFLNQLQKRIEAGNMSIADWKSARLLCALRGWTTPRLVSEDAAESETPEAVVPEGCRPIFKDGITVAYLTPDGERVSL
jgi:hypothetical protein